MAWSRRDRDLWHQHEMMRSLYGRSETKKNPKNDVKTAKKTAPIPKIHRQVKLTAFF